MQTTKLTAGIYEAMHNGLAATITKKRDGWYIQYRDACATGTYRTKASAIAQFKRTANVDL